MGLNSSDWHCRQGRKSSLLGITRAVPTARMLMGAVQHSVASQQYRDEPIETKMKENWKLITVTCNSLRSF